MRHTGLLVATLSLIALNGCSSNQSSLTASQSTAGDGTCKAEAVQGLLGKLADSQVLEQAHRQSAARTARVLVPGDAISLEYDSQRLNIEINEAEIIERISCG